MPVILALAVVLASTGVNVHYCPSGDVHVGLFPKLPCGEVRHCDCDCDCCRSECGQEGRDDCVDDYFQVDVSAPCPHFEHQIIQSVVIPSFFLPSLTFCDFYESSFWHLKVPLLLRTPQSVEVMRI